jgi:hypothetical protein
MDILATYIDAEDFPNLLIVGGEGTGKRYAVEDFLRRRYGEIEWRITHLQETDDDILYSSVGYFLDLRIHRRSIIPIIQALVTSKNVATGLYNIFVIRHFEELGLVAQGSLRRIIERTKDVARFIILHTGEPSSIIAPIQSRLQLISFSGTPSRLPAHIAELYDRFRVHTCLPALILPWVFNELDVYILNQPWTKLVDIREMLFALIDRGYSLKTISREYLHHLYTSDTAHAMLIRNNLPKECLEYIIKYDDISIEKDVYQLEYILVQIKRWGRFK